MRLNVSLCILSIIVLGNMASAQNYKVDWSVISCGGGSGTSSSYKLDNTVAQSTAGFVYKTNVLDWVGFWAGDIPSPAIARDIAGVKSFTDGKFVSIAGKVATTYAADFTDYLYIEDSDRTAGIRVAIPPSKVDDLIRGSVVNVVGTLSTAPNGERQLSGPVVIVITTTTPLSPLGVPGKSLGGSTLGNPPSGQLGITDGVGLNNVGLLVRTWGKVVSTESGYIDIDDGSGVVRVDTSAFASQPAKDSYISVVGISSLYNSSDNYAKLILPRGTSDSIVLY